MPLISGTDCTRMIRTYERNDESVRRARQRVPIIAVSASLMEEDRFDYISYGFDGWILKPIDFQRLDFLLQGINAPGLKREALYQPGRWEQGGWFLL
jgi:CheY-like chemotaxis protein